MLLVALAGLTGLFGRGPLSSGELGEEGSVLHVEYERFLRRDSPGQLTAYIGGAAIGADSTARLWLDRRWVAAMEVRGITPEPTETRAGANQIVYTFRLDPSSTPAHITYHLDTRAFGRLSGRVGLVNGPSYTFSQFAYP